MDAEKIEKFLEAIEGVNFTEWSRIKQRVDMHFNTKVSKLELGDPKSLKRNLEVEFNLRRFGDGLD